MNFQSALKLYVMRGDVGGTNFASADQSGRVEARRAMATRGRRAFGFIARKFIPNIEWLANGVGMGMRVVAVPVGSAVVSR
jgi:hypothetical protein